MTARDVDGDCVTVIPSALGFLAYVDHFSSGINNTQQV